MENNGFIQVVTCRCGANFAACVNGEQDDEWYLNLGKYITAGATVSYAETVKFKKCECIKKPQFKNPS